MTDKLRNSIAEVVVSEINANLQRGEVGRLTPEDFAEKVASMIVSSLGLTVESKREFDDPHDSFSTDTMTRYVSPWKW